MGNMAYRALALSQQDVEELRMFMYGFFIQNGKAYAIENGKGLAGYLVSRYKRPISCAITRYRATDRALVP